MNAGTRIITPTPPLEMLLRRLMTSASERSRGMLCWSLPISTPMVPSNSLGALY